MFGFKLSPEDRAPKTTIIKAIKSNKRWSFISHCHFVIREMLRTFTTSPNTCQTYFWNIPLNYVSLQNFMWSLSSLLSLVWWWNPVFPDITCRVTTGHVITNTSAVKTSICHYLTGKTTAIIVHNHSKIPASPHTLKNNPIWGEL